MGRFGAMVLLTQCCPCKEETSADADSDAETKIRKSSSAPCAKLYGLLANVRTISPVQMPKLATGTKALAGLVLSRTTMYSWPLLHSAIAVQSQFEIAI